MQERWMPQHDITGSRRQLDNSNGNAEQVPRLVHEPRNATVR
jgi:hypothetical protein